MNSVALYLKPIQLSAKGLIRLQCVENEIWVAILNDNEKLLQLCNWEYYKVVNEMIMDNQ